MTDSFRTTKVNANSRVGDPGTPAEYERVRCALVAKYNSLLADARDRLLAAIQRVEQGRTTADIDNGRELTQKIRELIDYLDQAKL